MFSQIIRLRIDAVKSYAIEGIATEFKLAEMMLDSLLPIIIDYEREGNTEDQVVFAWSGPSGLVSDIYYSGSPCQVSLSFIDRLQKARNELWKGLRARDNPEVLSLRPCWSRGLPIQSLATKSWLYHALQRPEEAPFLSSRAHELLFSPGHIILASVPREVETVGKFADNLAFIIHAIIENGEQAHKVKWVTRIWEHYSSILEANTLQLEIFQDWLVGLLRKIHYNREVDLHEIINLVHPSVLQPPILLISKVPTGPEVTEWDPEEPLQDKLVAYTPDIDKERLKEIPCIFLNYRMQCSNKFADGVIRTREIKPKQMSNPVAIWLKNASLFVTKDNNYSDSHQEAAILSALLFLDTLTPQSRLLQKSFPGSDYPRYGSTYLADEFITRVTRAADQSPINKAIEVLKWNTQNVSAELLRDLICSFLDTLKALPSASNYPTILNGTLQLTEILLNSSQPQLVVGVAVRIWKELVRDSSSHRKVSLVKIGRSLTPEQARHLMQSLVTYACETLQSQQTPSDSPEKPFIKVTTVKMLVQSLAEADFLAPFTRVQLLGSMCDATNHIDIRVEIIKSLFTLISQNKAAGLFNVLAKISSSAAGPSERKATTDNDWRIAEAGGSLPSILGSQRPILDLLVSNAAREIPKELHSNYVQKIVLPLVMESIRQHARWMTLLLARLGLSLSDLALTDGDIGPFSFDLVDQVLRNWARYLPSTYLQYHRNWGLAYLHRDSFNRITKALAACTDPTTNVANVQDHWQEFLNSQNSRLSFNYAYQFPSLLGGKEPNAITDEIFLEDFASRIEVFSRSPVEYNSTLRMFTVHPGSTLKILRGVRKARDELNNDLRSLYAFATNLMSSIFDTTENVRKEGWSPKLTTHPMTLPSKFEYEVEMLPSPSWKPESSRPALDEFVSCIIGLISKYAADPVLLMQIDVLTPILLEVRQEDRVACALLLGENLKDENNPHEIVAEWVRVKLAVNLLQAVNKWNEPLEESALNMIEEWKGSNVAMVRQIAWEWDWKWEWSA
ncbi:hypothetical protein N7466_001333 [Penicillium verhagenii]|uniref:uncharacterized protein n=1 Tax=Penicillium verhagenii TaxID=1562060 RepID=UPI0025453D73|nr:uncharacterized protein N7466_001333 [Penicillium verhagenii]KAJ5948318.1 hypothetical protein N7466_001333 [Penicillium verhagenii]